MIIRLIQVDFTTKDVIDIVIQMSNKKNRMIPFTRKNIIDIKKIDTDKISERLINEYLKNKITQRRGKNEYFKSNTFIENKIRNSWRWSA